MKHHLALAAFVLVSGVVGFACGQSTAPAETPLPVAQDAATAAREATATLAPAPSSTPVPPPTPTELPRPTASQTPTTAPTPAATRTATATPSPLPEPETLLGRINAAMASLSTVRVESTIVVLASRDAPSELISMVVEGEVELGRTGDNWFRVTIRAASPGVDLTVTSEGREVDGIGYSQDPFTKEWQSQEGGHSLAGVFGGPGIAGLEYGLLRLDDITLESALLDGAPAYRLAGTVTDDPTIERMELWVGVDDLLVRRISTEGVVHADSFGGMVPTDLGQLVFGGTYRLSRFDEPVKVVAPLVKSTPTAAPVASIDSPLGPMALYESTEYPFSIRYPADWTQSADMFGELQSAMGVAAQFVGKPGQDLAITEEDLSVLGLGQLTLKGYADMGLSLQRAMLGAEITSREQTVSPQGVPIEVLEFSML